MTTGTGVECVRPQPTKIPIEWAEKGIRKEGLRPARAAPHGEEERRPALTPSSRAWSRDAPSASACPSFRRKIRTIAFWRTNEAASTHLLFLISGMLSWGPIIVPRVASSLSLFWPTSAGSMAHAFIEQETEAKADWLPQKRIMPSWRWIYAAELQAASSTD